MMTQLKSNMLGTTHSFVQGLLQQSESPRPSVAFDAGCCEDAEDEEIQLKSSKSVNHSGDLIGTFRDDQCGRIHCQYLPVNLLKC